MLRLYYKYCGTVYNFYHRREPELASFFTFLLTTTALFFNLMAVLDFLAYFRIITITFSKGYLFLNYIVVGILNYVLVFATDKQKQIEVLPAFKIGVIIYLLFTVFLTIFGAYLVRPS